VSNWDESRKKFSEIKAFRPRADDFNSFHNDPDVPRFSNTGFAPECAGCYHKIIDERKPGKESIRCVYIIEPKAKKFPCFFKDHVPLGGWDGKYGATVNNYIKDERSKGKTFGSIAFSTRYHENKLLSEQKEEKVLGICDYRTCGTTDECTHSVPHEHTEECQITGCDNPHNPEAKCIPLEDKTK